MSSLYCESCEKRFEGEPAPSFWPWQLCPECAEESARWQAQCAEAEQRQADSRSRVVTPVSSSFTAGRENGKHRRPKGYATWRPQAKTQELLDQIEEILKAYEDYLPLTVRQIFYRLVAAYGYPKDEAAYERLGDKLVRARRAKLIPFEYIRDDGVVTYSSPWHESPDDFRDDTARRIREYRRDRQAGQRVRVELWCEAAGMAPQLAQVADEYSVPVFSSGGFSSLSAIRLVAERALEHGVPTIMLHVGDYDPSGASIFESGAEDACAFVDADRTVLTTRLEAHRVALTEEQVTALGLETAPAKESDLRSRGWKGETCQLEALAPDQLAEIVEEAIRSHLDLNRLQEQVDAEDRDRAELLGLPRGDE